MSSSPIWSNLCSILILKNPCNAHRGANVSRDLFPERSNSNSVETPWSWCKKPGKKKREGRGTKSHGCAWSQTFLNWISCENPVFWFLWVCTFGQIGPPDLPIFFCVVFIMKFTSFERIFDPTLHPRHLGVLLLLDNLEIRLVLNSSFSFVVWVSETVRTRQWAVGKCFRNCFELEEARRNVLWSPNT